MAAKKIVKYSASARPATVAAPVVVPLNERH
jgi:hypothetical protein